MAKIEIFDGFQILNVEQRVGLNKPNHWSDIVIVQTLLKYVREGGGGERGFNFLPDDPSPLPNPDGNFRLGENHSLDRLILKYQKAVNGFMFARNARPLLTEDGVISRAKGFPTLGGGRRFTIEEINARAQDWCRIRSKGRGENPPSLDHITDIQKTFPQVTAALYAFTLPF